METRKGSFFAFEGIDGSGKSTQIRLLTERLKKEGILCDTTMEPTDSLIGSMIHNIMTGRMKADYRVIAALFAADRLDHLLNDVNGIVKKIDSGVTVLVDRYVFSSYAYQSVDLPMDWIVHLNEESMKILHPTATIFIDIEPETAMERIRKNRLERELFEELSRLRLVREKYLEAFERFHNAEKVIRIDGNRSQEQIAEEIWEQIRGFVKELK